MQFDLIGLRLRKIYLLKYSSNFITFCKKVPNHIRLCYLINELFIYILIDD